MKVKAQGLLNAAKYIEESYGPSALREVVRACSDPVRERYASALAIEWHPVEELVEFLDVADKQLGTGDGRIAEAVGAAGARTNLKRTMTRVVFYVARPDFLLHRIAGLWKQFNDEGSMAMLAVTDFSTTIEVRGVRKPEWLFCCTITGWAREIVEAFGGTSPTARHVECRARGDARCVWEVRWTGVRKDDLGNTKRDG